MAANGGGPPEFLHMDGQIWDHDEGIKKEEQFASKPTAVVVQNHVENNMSKASISIAERRATKCGFNASNINTARFKTTGGDLQTTAQVQLPCFTIPSGVSPSALLDSPIMLPNAQAQLSPTTGTFQCPPPNHDSLKLKLKDSSNSDSLIAMDQYSYISEAQAVPDSLSNNSRVENTPPFEDFEYPRDWHDMTRKDGFEDTIAESAPVLGNEIRETDCLSMEPCSTRNQMFSHNDQNGKERSKPNLEKYHKGACFPKEVAKYSEDGFYWRKYGQKHVKGSEFPRSYYKCTNTNCPVRKKVERSHDGQITEIVYKGYHNHPKPQPFKRFSEISSDMNEGSGSCFKTEGATAGGSSGWRPDSIAGISSTPFLSDFSDPLSRSKNSFEPMETQEFSSAFCSQDGSAQNEASPESNSFSDDDENGEWDPKKRRRSESFSNETAIPRSTREPRVVVQIESDIDILDDGYRWRKYGQKVVKGNPNPRSYYKCTTPGCPVRKHVERAANDIKSVITTYEGKHNHEVPSGKTGSLVISDVANLSPAVAHCTIPTPSPLAQKPDQLPKGGKQVQDLHSYLERKPILNYNELMRSNLPGNFARDLNFGAASSVYPLSFPPFHSLPYGPFLMNGNHIKSYHPFNFYPVLPDYTSLPSQVNQVPGSAANVPLAGNFHFNNYAALQPSSRGQEVRECHTKLLKPKEEHKDEGELYDTGLSIPDRGM